ncbi:hypothetical protein [Aquipseudomonas alcaligenes]|uniref:hypothetical protein n=1 Tax=Aquipseudomonas alcaligenes TaxID=43263 RepID=UPI0037494121
MIERKHQLWIFLAIAALSLAAGLLFERPAPPLNLLCSGSTAEELETQTGQQWLLHQHAIDLRADGLGDAKSSSRLLDAASGQILGYRHRTTSFKHRRSGERLLLHVQQSNTSGTDSLENQQLASAGQFLFTEQADLTFPMRRLDPASLLISNGLGVTLLCVQNLPRN